MGIKIEFVDGTHYISGWMVVKSKDGDLITGDCDITGTTLKGGTRSMI